jgi:hypothetical protein
MEETHVQRHTKAALPTKKRILSAKLTRFWEQLPASNRKTLGQILGQIIAQRLLPHMRKEATNE